MSTTLTGNEQRAAWHACVAEREQRRGEQVATAAREAVAQATNPIEKVKRGYFAARAAEAAFDAAEPELHLRAVQGGLVSLECAAGPRGPRSESPFPRAWGDPPRDPVERASGSPSTP
jgi:hypothetical protein